jgi:MFS transporter, PPP family, 3-phenylpropionic acid transporter
MISRPIAQLRVSPNNIIIQLMALMFFSSMGRGLIAPYVNLYLSEIGTSGTAIGLIVAIASLVELSMSPVLNNLADKHSRHRLLLIIQYGILSIGAFFLAFSDQVIILGGIVILIELGKRSSVVLSLQLTLIRLEEINQNILGRVRAFNAIGFSLANLSQTVIFAIAGFTGMFFTAGVIIASSSWFTRVLPRQASNRKKLGTLAPRSRKFYWLVLIQIFVQLGVRSGFTFWLIHITNNLGVFVEDIGIVVALMALSEAPFFYLFDSLLKRFNVRIIYMMGTVCMGAMWLLLGIAPSAAWIILILPLRGFGFALLNLSILVLISRISDPRNVATNQSLLQITVPSLATLFVAPLMGWIYDHYVAWIYFGVCALMMVVGALMMLVMYRVMIPTLIESDEGNLLATTE